MSKLLYEDLTDKIIRAAIEVHKNLGPGLLESAYEECFLFELIDIGLIVKQQITIPIKYKDINIKTKYRLDLLVEDKVIVEIKSVEKLMPIHEAQLITYLKLSGYRVGLLINFNENLLRNGIKRRII
ncbi:MAG: GxxExxY protein [Candidatus Cloacimonetes bacterium]|jgi:GxxExxY protein|nr:GxxExxY protein [Candidatus Cloacimonadota bacterium]MBT4332848.1 GxxExxY protein [Candidatus Cloacimonadota bacterium]MBT4576326.1 GxxExxY protein [Candidatus Cloacimonadota bacterium]